MGQRAGNQNINPEEAIKAEGMLAGVGHRARNHRRNPFLK